LAVAEQYKIRHAARLVRLAPMVHGEPERVVREVGDCRRFM
jgi:hypothetical protein